MSEHISIAVRMANRQYKIKVPLSNEEAIRKSLQLITDTTSKLKQQFPGRDEQDYLAMTLIDFITTQNIHANQTALSMQPSANENETMLLEKLTKISHSLDL